jgi:hypothetical protein
VGAGPGYDIDGILAEVINFEFFFRLGARVAQWIRSLDLTTHTNLSLKRREFASGFVNYKKGCTRLAAASDKDRKEML